MWVRVSSLSVCSFFFFGLYSLFAALAYRQWRIKPKVIWAVTGALVVLAGLIVTIMATLYGASEPPFLPPRLWNRIMPGNHWAEIKGPLLQHFGSYFNNWMILGTLRPIVLVPLTVVLAKRKEFIIGIFSLFLLASYIYLFCVGGAYRFLINGTTVNRSYLQILPALLFTCIIMIATISKRKSTRAIERTKD